MRRAHGSRREHGERDSGLPVSRRVVGGVRPATTTPRSTSFRRDPVRIWDFYGRRFAFLADAEPNDAHRALAELERRGLVEAVVTQNIDLLHERAGSADVIEVHGSIRRAVCLRCGGEEPLERVLAQLGSAPAPLCPDCGEVLKPDVVFFGELLPVAAIDRATALARRARAAARRRLLAGGASGRGAAVRDARRRRIGRDREQRPDCARRPRRSSSSTAVPATSCAGPRELLE